MGEEKERKYLEYRPIRDSVIEAVQYIGDRKDGSIKSLKTPWDSLNRASMNGLVWYDIVGIGGMSGSGKTAICSQLESGLVELNSYQPISVLSFNFEMLARNLVTRKLATELNLSTK